MDLAGAEIAPARIGQALFRGANLKNANFDGCELQQTRFDGADLSGARFWGANLVQASLNEAGLQNAYFDRADMTMAKLKDGSLSNACFFEARMRGADVSNADASNADFSGARLDGVNFAQTNLQGANFTGSWLRGAILDCADITDANLTDTLRSGWSIKNVTCQRAFWDREGKESVSYQIGHFERAYAEKPLIIIEQPGMKPTDLAMLPIILEQLMSKNPGTNLYIRSIQDGGRDLPVISIVMEKPAGQSSEVDDNAAMRRKIQFYMECWQQADTERQRFMEQNLRLTDRLMEIPMGVQIGTVNGPVHAGTGDQKNESISYSMNDLEGIRQLVSDLLEDRGQWEAKVPDKNADKFEAALINLKQELEEREPDLSMIQAGVVSLKNMLESAAGTAIYTGSLATLMALAT